MRVIVVRQDEYDVLVVVRIPDGSDAEATFKKWKRSAKGDLDRDVMADVYWEEVEVLELK